MPGADPRSEDNTDELPPAVESFALDPALRGSTSYIVGRAAAVLGLLRRDAWAGEEQSDPEAIGPFRLPLWSDEAVTNVLEDLADRRGEQSLLGWRAELPDGAPTERRARLGRKAEVQSSAARELAGRR